MTQTTYRYYEVTVEFLKYLPEKSALAGDFFTGQGIGFQEIVFGETSGKAFASFYTSSKLVLNRLKNQFARQLKGKGFKFKSRFLVKEDWFDKWQLDYQIMPIGKRFILVPLWHLKKYQGAPGRRVPIFLDPKGASGSGQHPTTQIMTVFLESIAGKFVDCLDLGAGTGILGIIASKLGAGEVTAVDLDAVAVKAAKFNLRYNRVPRFEVFSHDVTVKQSKTRKYSLICANLISPVLETIQDFLFRNVKPGGYLAVSGVHIQNFSAFQKQFRHPKFRCLKTMKKRGWTGMLFKRIR